MVAEVGGIYAIIEGWNGHAVPLSPIMCVSDLI